MSDFDNREKAFEKKFEVDEELKFKINSRAGKLLGLWVAGQLGLAGADAEAYAKAVVDADLKHPGHADLMQKIEKDLQAKGVQISRHVLEKEFGDCQKTAHAQITGKA